jgi:hypothetical protein
MSNQRDWGAEIRKGKFGIGKAAKISQGENINPTIRAPWERRPQAPTIKANGNARALVTLGRAGMA